MSAVVSFLFLSYSFQSLQHDDAVPSDDLREMAGRGSVSVSFHNIPLSITLECDGKCLSVNLQKRNNDIYI